VLSQLFSGGDGGGVLMGRLTYLRG
jgi:hypothetical protein